MLYRLVAASLAITCFIPSLVTATDQTTDFTRYEWTLENEDADWDPRAGLQVVELDDRIYLLGGRTPIDPAEVPVFGASVIHGDVWRTDDQGQTWDQILATETPGHWAPRAYFQSLVKDDEIFVIGGQDFTVIDNPDSTGPPQIAVSEFFDDVWSSSDGVDWIERTAAAGWEGRAGLSAAVYNDEIYVLGGSVNDDDAIGGPGGPPRIYFNDVWKSADGETWVQVTDAAPWEPRAGGIAVAFNGYLYMIGGEAGFNCFPVPCDPPYFNDVWRTQDGMTWELMTAEAEWASRPGHQAVVIRKHLVLFGGFGQSQNPADPFAPANPMDVWVSIDGAEWEQVDDAPWNATSPADIKYDLDALVVDRGPEGGGPAILTFGGDRETFNPFDPVNYLNVDNDVWRYTLPSRYWIGNSSEPAPGLGIEPLGLRVAPNPFNPSTTISFTNPVAQPARLVIYDVAGRKVRTLVDQDLAAGSQQYRWDGTNDRAGRVASGVYLFRLQLGGAVHSGRLLLDK